MFKVYHKDDGRGHHKHDHTCGSDCNHDHHHHEEETVVIIPQKKELLFSDFVSLFPEISLPITLSTDAQREIELHNEPLNAAWMGKFVLDENQIDDFTEFMAGFKIPDTKDFTALVYWQASLEGNAFFMSTFSKSGSLIDHKLIAGTLYLEDGMKQLVCSIAKDWTINRVEGILGANGEIVKIDDPKMTFMQISMDGEIVED
jgi:hypothetical protein